MKYAKVLVSNSKWNKVKGVFCELRTSVVAMQERETGCEEGLVIKREKVKSRGIVEVLRCSRMRGECSEMQWE